MDFGLTKEQEDARREMFEVCKELSKKQPPDWGRSLSLESIYSSDEGWEFNLYCAKEFAKRGWLSIDWPTEYGGQGRPKIYKALLAEAKEYYKLPGEDLFGVHILAPTLLWFGSEEQKRKYLPPIAAGETFWCQLWSEPGAGSDLANVSTRGVRQGDEYILNGQKIWTTGAHRADWGFMLFKTDPNADPKHRGLSYILVDMKSPGITVKPLLFMNREHAFNEVFFDDVHIPVENRLGEENKGWLVTRGAMNAERSGIGTLASIERDFDDLVEYCNNTIVDGEPLAKNAVIRDQLADVACKLEANKALSYRMAWEQDSGKMDAIRASATKVFGGELAVRVVCLGNEILGPYGQVVTSKWAPVKGYFENEYQTILGMSIAAGSNEIQRNLIAWEGLGLPRLR